MESLRLEKFMPVLAVRVSRIFYFYPFGLILNTRPPASSLRFTPDSFLHDIPDNLLGGGEGATACSVV